ncbi:MAG: (2Fe-2S)-binding protein [PVC group bacterium]
MAEKITFTVNGTPRTVEIEGWEKLIYVLREKLNLTGTKRGCDDASCGACVVVVDGEAKKSCVFPATRLPGTEVVTIEGLAEGTKLHPIQRALIDAGAVQCGYCMPGIVMELSALFRKNPRAADGEIKDALALHLCRCTGYEAIWEGALLAREYLAKAAKR